MYLICNLISTLAAESIKHHESSVKFTKQLNKQFKIGFSNKIPKITLHGIKYQNRIVKTGTILIRPLAKEIITDISGEYHFGVVLGADANGEEYLLEMTNYPNNLRIVSKKKFLAGYPLYKLGICKEPQKVFSPEDIYSKAKKYEDSPYSILNLNCKDIAFYCVDGIIPVRRGDLLNKGVLRLNELCMNLAGIYSKQATDEAMKKFHNANIEKLKQEQKVIAGSIKSNTTSDMIKN